MRTKIPENSVLALLTLTLKGVISFSYQGNLFDRKPKLFLNIYRLVGVYPN